VADAGDTETVIDVGAITVITPTPLFFGSAIEVAASCTLGLCEARVDGVVYVTLVGDVADKVPHDVPWHAGKSVVLVPCSVHVTPLFAVSWSTVAVKVWLKLKGMFADVGLTTTACGGVMVGSVTFVGELYPPPQPANIANTNRAARVEKRNMFELANLVRDIMAGALSVLHGARPATVVNYWQRLS